MRRCPDRVGVLGLMGLGLMGLGLMGLGLRPCEGALDVGDVLREVGRQRARVLAVAGAVYPLPFLAARAQRRPEWLAHTMQH